MAGLWTTNIKVKDLQPNVNAMKLRNCSYGVDECIYQWIWSEVVGNGRGQNSNRLMKGSDFLDF